MKKNTELNKKDIIFVVAQQFYGNRTGTQIHRDEVDLFLRGILSPELFPGEVDTVDRKVVKVPGTENVVIVYDQQQEDEYINVDYPESARRYKEATGKDLPMKVSCEIPEIGFKIYTRCIACRVDEEGVLQSLEHEDGLAVMKYLA